MLYLIIKKLVANIIGEYIICKNFIFFLQNNFMKKYVPFCPTKYFCKNFIFFLTKYFYEIINTD